MFGTHVVIKSYYVVVTKLLVFVGIQNIRIGWDMLMWVWISREGQGSLDIVVALCKRAKNPGSSPVAWMGLYIAWGCDACILGVDGLLHGLVYYLEVLDGYVVVLWTLDKHDVTSAK